MQCFETRNNQSVARLPTKTRVFIARSSISVTKWKISNNTYIILYSIVLYYIVLVSNRDIQLTVARQSEKLEASRGSAGSWIGRLYSASARLEIVQKQTVTVEKEGSDVAAAGASAATGVAGADPELAAGGLCLLPEVWGNHCLAGRPVLRLQLRLLPVHLPPVLRVHGPHPPPAHPGREAALRRRPGEGRESHPNGPRHHGDGLSGNVSRGSRREEIRLGDGSH